MLERERDVVERRGLTRAVANRPTELERPPEIDDGGVGPAEGLLRLSDVVQRDRFAKRVADLAPNHQRGGEAYQRRVDATLGVVRKADVVQVIARSPGVAPLDAR